MCILFVYTNPKPVPGEYRLIIASNRDEYFNRPASEAVLCGHTKIIGGRDMEPGREGGMWLGLSGVDLRFAALLNLRGGQRPDDARGRGPIVHDFLTSLTTTGCQYVKTLSPQPPYSCFNFVTIEFEHDDDRITVNHHTNWPESKTVTFHGDQSQVLGFGNSCLARPLQKVIYGREIFDSITRKHHSIDSKERLIDELIQLLKRRQQYLPDDELRRIAPSEVDYLSSIFVQSDQYGTRTHSIVLVDSEWNAEFIEHNLVMDKGDPLVPETWHSNVISVQRETAPKRPSPFVVY